LRKAPVLNEDGSNLKEFIRDFKTILKEDWVSGKEGNVNVQKRLAKEVSTTTDSIKETLARYIMENGLESFVRSGSSWFVVEDERRQTGVDKKKKPIYEYNNSNTGLYDATYTSVENDAFKISAPNDSGRFGKFFENVFFGGGAGNLSKPDIEEAEIKANLITSDDFKKIIQKDTERAIGRTEVSRGVTGSKATSFRHIINDLIKANKSDAQIQKVATYLVMSKYINKLGNLLIATVDVDYGEGWMPTESGWEKRKGNFFFTSLYLYYKLLVKKLFKIVYNNLRVEKNALTKSRLADTSTKRTTFGNVLKIERGSGDNVIASMEVQVQASFLPLPTSKGRAGISGRDIFLTLATDASSFYAATEILYDDRNKNYRSSVEFFNNLLDKQK
jgi:hypothetical protein